MPRYKYLIIGGGMTADAAVRGIREVDPEGAIGLIAEEAVPPYKRPPLTKGLWKGEAFEEIWLKTEELGVEIRGERRVRTVDPAGKRVVDEAGAEYTFEKLLLATGGTPRRLPFGGDEVIYYRTVRDYERLRGMTAEGREFAVIGGGFIGSEIAAGLAMTRAEVTMMFPDEIIGTRVFPRDLARFVTGYYRDKGVRVLPNDSAVGIEVRAGKNILKTRNQAELAVDGVVAGIGIEPNVELAKASGLALDNGIVVDELLRTSAPDIYAAGDVASFFNPALGKRIRVEHEDNANTMGRSAGRSMAGRGEPYHHLPFFYSDLFELGYEAVGETDPRHEVFADWKDPNREGVLYYLEKGRVRGVLLWNVWNQVEAARRLIAEPGPFRSEDLKGRLPE